MSNCPIILGGVPTSRDNDPKSIHKDEVKPEVIGLWAVEDLPRPIAIEQTSEVVQSVAVKLTRRHQRLDWIAIRGVSGNEECRQESQRAPSDLGEEWGVSKGILDAREGYGFGVYRGDGLHDQHEWVGEEISRVG
jgi:hypothetical protein